MDDLGGTIITLDDAAECWYDDCDTLTKTAITIARGDGQYEVRAVCYDHLASEIAGQEQEGMA